MSTTTHRAFAVFAWLGALALLSAANPVPDQQTTPDDRFAAGAATQPATRGAAARKVLFIGNSYTVAAGGQKDLVCGMLQSRGWTVDGSTYIRAGETIEGFILRNDGEEPTYYERQALSRLKTDAERDAFMRKLRDDRKATRGKLDEAIDAAVWDIAVVQVWTDAGDPVNQDFHKNITAIVQKIRRKSPQAKIVLYMVWSSQNDPKRQEVISASCYDAARRERLLVAPAGEAAWMAMAQDKDLVLHRTPQDSHPGLNGAYLVACSIVATITDQSPVGLPTKLTVAVSYDFPIGVKDPDKDAKTKALGGKRSAEWVIDADTGKFLQETAWKAYTAGKSRLVAQ